MILHATHHLLLGVDGAHLLVVLARRQGRLLLWERALGTSLVLIIILTVLGLMMTLIRLLKGKDVIIHLGVNYLRNEPESLGEELWLGFEEGLLVGKDEVGIENRDTLRPAAIDILRHELLRVVS